MTEVGYSIEEHIAVALRACRSPVTLDEVRKALFSGRLRLCVGRKMSGSAWLLDDGRAEIVHVAGEWDDEEARWMAGCLDAWALEHQAPITWSGRRGWPRFLKQRGMI